MKKIFSPLLCMIVLPTIVMGQNFAYKSKVNPVSNTNFYKITINADIAARSNATLQDLRLFDNEGTEIPYLLHKEQISQQEAYFKTFPFTINTEGNKVNLIVENQQKLNINKLLFTMKNAEATRLVRISGSEDKVHWYVVKDSFNFESLANTNTPMVKKALIFPETDYSFFKIEITNGPNQAPLNIINIGNDKVLEKQASFQLINGLKYTIKDSNKTTIIRCKVAPGNRIDQLRFSITAPETYMRKAVIEKITEDTYNDDYNGVSSIKKRTYSPGSFNIELSSEKPNNIITSGFLGTDKCDSFTIYLFNNDDVPLQIKEIKAFQLVSTITAKLEKDKSYFLYFGDSLLYQPAYDLVYFEQKIPKSIQTIECGKVLPKEQKVKEEYNGNKDKWIVWIGLAIAGITILLLTLNMMKKMKAEA